MKKLVFSVIFINLIFSVFSQPSKRELIRDLIPVDEIGRSVLQAFVKNIYQNPDYETNIDLVDQFINMNNEEITESIINVFDSLFNYEEIQQLGNFYKSPEGIKHKEFLPLLIFKLMAAGQKWYESKQTILKVMLDTLNSDQGKSPVKEFNYTEVEFERDKPYRYRKSKKSKILSLSEKFGYKLYYNDKIWKEIDPASLNPFAEKAFRMIDKEVYGIIVAENNDLNLKDLRYTAIYNLNSGSTKFEIQNDALRSVNGIELLSMKFVATIDEMKIKYHNYYYTDGSKVIQFSTFTPLDSYENNKDKMEDLLNGLVIK